MNFLIHKRSWRPIFIILQGFCLCIFGQKLANGATLQVPGNYATVAQAVSAAKNGDTIEIAAGQYSSGIISTINKSNLTIRGVGGRAHLNATGVNISNGKAIFVTTGNDIILQNIEFSGAKVPDENGAGIRHEGGLLTVKNCYFHDNENGILTSNQGTGGELVVQNSEFNHNGLGRAGYTHNIYVGHIGRFVFQYSYSHHATHGHNIKSRAEKNYILYSRIMDEESGNASYQIDLPNGGLSFLVGNSVHQGTNAENSTMISYAAEGASNPIQEIYLSGNTLVNDRHIGYGVRLSGSPLAVLRNNIFDNLTTAVNGTPTSFIDNLVGGSSGFVNRQTYDYHLTSTSPARDMGEEPGVYQNYNLLPTKEYQHPLQSVGRQSDGQLDIGAYEFGASVPPPPVQGTSTIPATKLLLKEHK